MPDRLSASLFPSALLILVALIALVSFSRSAFPHHISAIQNSVFERNVPEAPMKHHSLDRRDDDYSCSAAKPCPNGACCGASGYCGYGPAYCGHGCKANCDAVAECGQFAATANQTCALNVCCSQYGFCGTTTDFCNDKCQSNCVEHPSPPSGSSAKPLDKVIGYWESWRANADCHPSNLDDLPLDALTHVYYAFASIDPSSYELIAMDGTADNAGFDAFSRLKNTKSDLKLVVSVGGWAFSDNNTATQPLFGNIARDRDLTSKFADNAANFLTRYGFDGLDIDWEYPGAPDRGGKPDDVQNFVSLMAALRARFDKESKHLELTFTAPTSYWYLRWFDLAGLLKAADAVNVMSYDLHGAWDATNPIGAVVQGHTNLTEIKLAMELFWRAGTPPDKIAMGFGFYGRSFKLADPACTSPGCAFSGDATPGKCSNASGILAYYEIQDILNGGSSNGKRDTAPRPIYDEAGAVNYVVYDNDQWVSYDDQKTLQKKQEWATSIGIGGSLIWASDLDDTAYTAHSGLVGRQVVKTPFLKPGHANDGNWADQNGKGCHLADQCRQHDGPRAEDGACPSGETVFGWDAGQCSGGYGTAICCPQTANLNRCTWRGGGHGDCNGQCVEGEIFIQGGGTGGWPAEDGADQTKCRRGGKAFCCGSKGWEHSSKGCRWTAPDEHCGTDEDELGCKLSETGVGKVCGLPAVGDTRYCCPKTDGFKDCLWRGNTDCTDNYCRQDEIELARDKKGDSISYECHWGRQRALCCKTPVQARCNIDICEAYGDLCPGPDDEIDYIYPGLQNGTITDPDEGDEPGYRRSKRVTTAPGSLNKRGGKEKHPAIIDEAGILLIFSYITAAWPSAANLFQSSNGDNVVRTYFTPRSDWCEDLEIGHVDIPPAGSDNQRPSPNFGHTEHLVEKNSYQSRLLYSWGTGALPGNSEWRAGPLNRQFLEKDFPNYRMPNSLPKVGESSSYRPGEGPVTPADRLAEALGSNNNRENFVLTNDDLNMLKGRIFDERRPFADAVWRRALDGIRTSRNFGGALTFIRKTMMVFTYMNDPLVSQRFRNTLASIEEQVSYMDEHVDSSHGQALALTKEFNDLYFRNVENEARTWVRNAIASVRAVVQADPDLAASDEAFAALVVLTQFEDAIDSVMRIPDK